MLIFRSLQDIENQQEHRKISAALAAHLTQKLESLRLALEPQTNREDFSLKNHGPIGVMERGDNNLSAIGLPEKLDQIQPEWISRLQVGEEAFHILYVLADNDYMQQVYLSNRLLGEELLCWLEEQSVEEEAERGESDENSQIAPF